MKTCKKSVKFFLSLVCCVFSVTAFAAVTPFIIDTDVGIDDAIAILYFLNKPQIEVAAITIESDGVTPCETAFANISGILALTRKQTIPVACGNDTPLPGGHVFPAI